MSGFAAGRADVSEPGQPWERRAPWGSGAYALPDFQFQGISRGRTDCSWGTDRSAGNRPSLASCSIHEPHSTRVLTGCIAQGREGRTEEQQTGSAGNLRREQMPLCRGGCSKRGIWSVESN